MARPAVPATADGLADAAAASRERARRVAVDGDALSGAADSRPLVDGTRRAAERVEVAEEGAGAA